MTLRTAQANCWVRLGFLNRQQRLSRWTEVLERDPTRTFRLLSPSWCQSSEEFACQSIAGTAIEIACRDPVLRLDGLTNSGLKEALVFFELSFADADRVLSGSRYSQRRSAASTIHRIQNIADKRRENTIFYLSLLIVLFAAVVMSALLG